MPLVSVIIPVHNGQDHLRRSLGSVARQTLTDIEILVVDDGSTDDTRQIIEEFASQDPRVRYLAGPAIGSAGAARNFGMDRARGEYLSFLDSDDTFAPTMLAEMVDRAQYENADIALTKFRVVDSQTGDAAPADWGLRLQYFPPRAPIRPKALGDYLFYAVHPAVWNKLFRADFVKGQGLRFQELRRTNDLFFSFMALALARRLSVVPGYLIDYHVANPNSLQGSLTEAPLEFVEALDALEASLKQKGVFERLERAFGNVVVETCLNSLRKVRTADAFAKVHQATKDEIFPRFGIIGREPDYFIRPSLVSQVKAITELSTEQLMFRQLLRTQESLARAKADAHQTLREMSVRANAERLAAVAKVRPEVAAQSAATAESGESRPDVSVVIPVHNTAPYLADCLASVRSQTGITVEIICIDDGSTDGSAALLAQASRDDPRIQIVSQENAGPSVARNRGIELATGRYVAFLDSDDSWRFDGLIELVAHADAERLDMLLFDAVSVRGPGVADRVWDRYRNYYQRSAYPGVRSGVELMAEQRRAGEYRVQPCLYVVRRGFLNESGVRFYPGIAHEDNLFTFELMLIAQRVQHWQRDFYLRTMRGGSLTTAGSRLFSARGYLITYLEMQRRAGRAELPEPIATQVGSIIAGAFKQAIDNFSKVSTDVGDRLREVDNTPEAAAAVALMKRLRYEAQFKRASQRPSGAPAVKKKRSIVRRAASKVWRTLGMPR